MATFEKRKGKNGTTITARVRYKGFKFTETFKNLTYAKNWAKKMEGDIDEGRAPAAESTKHTVNDLLDDYETNGLDVKHPGYKKLINQLKVWRTKIGGLKLSDVTSGKLCSVRRKIRFVETSRGENRSNATVNRYMSALSGAFTHATDELQWLTINPARQVKRLPENPPPIRFLDKVKELPILMKACAQNRNPRLLPLFMSAICLGLRAGALLWLHRDEVNLEAKTIRIPAKRSKNNRAFTIGISEQLYPHIKYLCDNCHPESGLLFPSANDPFKPMEYRNDWDNALKLAGITDYRFHDNRHTCGSYLAMAGYSLGEIAELLNHKTLEMAKRYSHLADEYRVKLSMRMNQEFIAQASVDLACLTDIDHPAVQKAVVNECNDSETIKKHHLRLVK